MKTTKLLNHYGWIISFFALFLISGFFLQPFDKLIDGLINILVDSSVLITDYLAIGGIGATFINAGLLSLICVFILIKMDMKPNGSIILSLFLVFGFSFFGTNLLNVWPIIIGVYLYSLKKEHPFRHYIIVALMGTSLAPSVNQVFLLTLNNIGINSFNLKIIIALILAISVGAFIGFIMPPLVSHSMKIHEGFMLSNAGLASGFIAITFVALLKALGLTMESKYILSNKYTLELSIMLFVTFGSMVVLGLFYNKEPLRIFKDLNNESGRIVTDFFILYGENFALINMGLVGLVYTVLTLLITQELNGAFVAGIFTVAGFAAFGLNLRNVIPITLGSIIAMQFNISGYEMNTLMIIILFATSLAPFSGYYGIIWGIIAGFTHLCLTLNVSIINAGINLYNNGFVAGIITVLLLPIASSMRNDYE